MSRRRPVREHFGALLLAVFIAGGFFAPLVHQVHHGFTWAALRGTADATEACDHSEHGARFEITLPTFKGDTCPLCHHHLAFFAGFGTGLWAYQDADTYVLRTVRYLVQALPSPYLIRGPPLAS